MSSAKRGRVQKSESTSTPSILGFVTRKEPSANEVVNSFIDELLSSVVQDRRNVLQNTEETPFPKNNFES